MAVIFVVVVGGELFYFLDFPCINYKDSSYLSKKFKHAFVLGFPESESHVGVEGGSELLIFQLLLCKSRDHRLSLPHQAPVVLMVVFLW